MPVLLAGLLALATAGLAGCDGGSSAGSARAELRAAVDRTLDAESFHVTGHGFAAADAGSGSVRLIGDYNAPDRYRVETVPEAGPVSEVIQIGAVTYVAFDDPAAYSAVLGPAADGLDLEGRFVAVSPPGGDPSELVTAPLRAARRAPAVERDGETWRAETGAGTYRIEIEGGYVRSLVLDAAGEGAMPARLAFSRFDTAARVDPPPAAEVVTLPAGGALEVDTVDLPPPDGDVTTTLQFRGVVEPVEGGCATDGENPDAAGGARLPGDEDECFELGPAEVEVARVESVTARSDPAGGILLDLELSDDDAGALDRMAAAFHRRQIGIVAFGRVLSAPTVDQTEFGGDITIRGITAGEASRLRAALG